MKPTIDQTGIQIQSFYELYNEKAEGLKNIYGQDISLDQSTPDGQKLGIETKADIDLQVAIVELYNAMDPDLAAGIHLNRIIKYCGIRRKAATRSYADTIITAAHNLSLPANYKVQDENGNNWVSKDALYLTQGENTVTFVAENWGNVTAPSGSINKPVTIVLGVQSVTNPLSAIPGHDEETDEELRLRRNKSLENPSYSAIGGLFAKLANVDGVTDLVIYENVNDEEDPRLNLKGHSIWAVVEGGTVEDIGEAFALQKTAGTGRKGEISTIWHEALTRPDGSILYYTHINLFDRPELTELYIKLSVKRRNPQVPVDIDAIKQALAEERFYIAGGVSVTDLYCPVRSSGTSFTASGLAVSRDGLTWETEYLTAGYAERFVINAAKIDVTEVI